MALPTYLFVASYGALKLRSRLIGLGQPDLTVINVHGTRRPAEI